MRGRGGGRPTTRLAPTCELRRPVAALIRPIMTITQPPHTPAPAHKHIHKQHPNSPTFKASNQLSTFKRQVSFDYYCTKKTTDQSQVGKYPGGPSQVELSLTTTQQFECKQPAMVQAAMQAAMVQAPPMRRLTMSGARILRLACSSTFTIRWR